MNVNQSFHPHPWRASLRPEWVDYNGHLRDAYYTLLASTAVDDLMEQVGLDRAYREATGGTLYTLEMHVHYLQEVRAGDEVTVVLRPLATDAKRLHLRGEIGCSRLDGPAAVVEMLLLHVQQRPSPRSAPMPELVAMRLRSWLAACPRPDDAYASRVIGLTRPAGGA
jgi:acyl-CoA thioester hydrolase